MLVVPLGSGRGKQTSIDRAYASCAIGQWEICAHASCAGGSGRAKQTYILTSCATDSGSGRGSGSETKHGHR